MIEPTDSIEQSAEASILLLFMAKKLLGLRKAIAELSALEEDAANIIRFEIEDRNQALERMGKRPRFTIEFPAVAIQLQKRKMTRCKCHSVAPWDCARARSGEPVLLEEYEVARYVIVTDKSQSPPGVLRAVKDAERA